MLQKQLLEPRSLQLLQLKPWLLQQFLLPAWTRKPLVNLQMMKVKEPMDWKTLKGKLLKSFKPEAKSKRERSRKLRQENPRS